MAVSEADIAGARELFSGLGPLTTRKMFGGLGVYRDGTIFAVLLSDATLCLKAREPEMIATLEEMGATQWRPDRPDGAPGRMPYWTLPDAAIDDPDLACDLARRTLDTL